MIHLDIMIEEIDFDSLIDSFLPLFIDKLREHDSSMSRLLSGGMPADLAKTILRKLPPDKKERLAAELFNKNSDKIKARAELYARQNGVGVKIGQISAKP